MKSSCSTTIDRKDHVQHLTVSDNCTCSLTESALVMMTRENLLSVFANNNGADQPALPRSLITAHVIRLLGSILSKLYKCKGALSWYGKLTWESAHAWNLIILCLLIDLGMTFICMVHLSYYATPLLIYDVMYDITTIPQGTQL